MLIERQIYNNNKTKPWMQPLMDYFKDIKKYNDRIETIREKLCLIQNFNPNQLFDYLDFQKNGFLTSKNIIYFLNQTYTQYDEQYIRCLIHNYDKDGDFTLNINEFLRMILPNKNIIIKNKILSLINNQNDFINYNNIISDEIKMIFNELIKEEMNLAESSFFLVKKIYGSPKFTTYEAFVDIVKNESYITRRNLSAFLRENDFELNEIDIYMLMFRIDNDNDNRISYVEFQDLFYPLKQLEKYIDDINLYSVENINFNITNSDLKNNDLYNNKILDSNSNAKDSNNKDSGLNSSNIDINKTNNSLRNKDNDLNIENNHYNINSSNNNENFEDNLNNCNGENSNNNKTNNNKIIEEKISNENIIDNSKQNNKDKENDITKENKKNSTEIIASRETQDKNSQGFTNYSTEREIEKPKYNKLNIKNLKKQNCFKFTISDVRNKSFFDINNNNSFNNIIPVKNTNYNYIPPLSEKILNRTYAFNQMEKNNNNKNYRFNSPILSYKNNFEEIKDNDNEYYFPNYNIYNFNNINNDNNLIDKNNNYRIYENNNIVDNNYIISDKNYNNKEENIIYDNDNNSNLFLSPKTTRTSQTDNFLGNYPINLETPIKDIKRREFIEYRTEPNSITKKAIIKNDALFELLNDYVIQDLKTENILENLANCPDFNLINLFQSFLQSDYLDRKIVTAEDIYNTLNNMCLYINPNDIIYIYIKFNKEINDEKDPGFTYSEFCYMMTPKKYILAQNLNKKGNQKYFMGFNFRTKRILCALFKQFIDSEKSNEKYRKELIGNEYNMKQKYDYIQNLFNCWKKKDKKGLDEDDINIFMETNGRKLYQYEVELLMERFDKNKDGIIDFDEFFNEVIPKLN